MRVRYAARRDVLIRAADDQLAGLLKLQPTESGMHVVGSLPPGLDDRRADRSAEAHGV